MKKLSIVFLPLLVAACVPESPMGQSTSTIPLLDPSREALFSNGPFGSDVYDLAGPFTVETSSGTYDFEASWTGQHVHLIVFHRQGSATSDQLFQSDVGRMLELMPLDTRILFVSLDTDTSAIASFELTVNSILDDMPESMATHWRENLLFVTESAEGMTHWLGEVAQSPPIALAIDRSQRLQPVGMMVRLGEDINRLEHLAYTSRHYHFEAQRTQRLLTVDVDLVNGPRGSTWPRGHNLFTATFPDAATMAQYDTLEVDWEMGCDAVSWRDPFGPCEDWDKLAFLYYCPKDPETGEVTEENCTAENEIVRYVTAYHRGGRWITDISHFLPLFKEGGDYTFSANIGPWGSGEDYTGSSVRFRLANRQKSRMPVAVQPAFMSPFHRFDLEYNDKFEPISFEMPEGATEVDLMTVITGHGFGADVENCAEFCNHEHHFTLNNSETVVKDHPNVGRPWGCAERVGQGVIPNQLGTWYFGRGGWCPGSDIPATRFGLSNVDLENANTLTYQGLFDGRPYDPIPNGSDSTFSGNILMRTWLVFYAER